MPTTRQMTIAILTFAIILSLFLLSLASHAQDAGLFMGSIFDRLDTNRDGILTKDEVKAARAKMFDRVDTNRDGTITLAEMETARAGARARSAQRLARMAELRSEMKPPSEQFKSLDKSQDGKVSREEFMASSPWFDRMSRNGGVVTKEEFAAFIDGKPVETKP